MSVPTPHFLLFSRGERRNDRGEWSFVLQAADGSATLQASDSEPELRGERLELLAVVRGLEALDQPSRVTLVTPSKYVNRGIAYGLEEWRQNNWTWERYGQLVPVKNRDLWQRLDQALRVHQVEFRGWRFDPPHADGQGRAGMAGPPADASFKAAPPSSGTATLWQRIQARCNRWLRLRLEGWRTAILRWGTAALPRPRLD